MNHFEWAHFAVSWDVMRLVNGVCLAFQRWVTRLMHKTQSETALISLLDRRSCHTARVFSHLSHLVVGRSQEHSTSLTCNRKVFGKTRCTCILSSPTVSHLTVAHISLDLCVYKKKCLAVIISCKQEQILCDSLAQGLFWKEEPSPKHSLQTDCLYSICPAN